MSSPPTANRHPPTASRQQAAPSATSLSAPPQHHQAHPSWGGPPFAIRQQAAPPAR
ncbi:MAG: hypothetical protein LBH56_03605 [Coriobacteriales bacterium]|nr:hypothetical protein [Coriobacteriales bacterium]